MAAHLERSFQDLETAMERQELFMGSFAHELKTPMTSIIGYADLLRGQSLTPTEQQESANYIFTEGKRLESLSLKLLDLLVVRRQDFPLSQVWVPALLEETVALMRPSLGEAQLQLRYHFAKGSCYMEPDLVKSLVLNLLDNARKAMEPGGAIRFTSTMTPEGCILVVQDQGRGMEPQELEKITGAFYRVDKARSRAQGGAGLGLSLCQEIVDLHKGTMVFSSQPGQGTTVTVTLKGGRP
jgi:signal transduction histidine kinase